MSSFDADQVQEELFALAQKVIPTLDAVLDRSGGALQVISSKDGIHRNDVIGAPSNEKRGVYINNARIKAVELTLQLSQTSTARIADEEAEPPLYGGGIRCSNDWIIAFSGYPPEWDEALCVALACHFGLLTEDDEAFIVQFYNNGDRVRRAKYAITLALSKKY